MEQTCEKRKQRIRIKDNVTANILSALEIQLLRRLSAAIV